MVDLNLLSFFFFGFIFIQCEGKIIPPSGSRYFLPGSDGKIQWSFDNNLTKLTIRDWFLVNSKGGANTLLARISGVGSTPGFLLPGFAIEEKATLVIKNFDESKNGKYQFTFTGEISSDFEVSVIKKADAVVNCSNPVTLNKGDRITCLCRGENGNPAPTVTWYKDSKQIGEVRKNNNTLTIDGDNWRNRGTYTCKVETYPDAKFRDEKSIEVIINFKPTNTKIELVPNPVEVGGKVKITCSSDGFPEPNYIITHDDTRLITTAKTVTLRNVRLNYTGTYKCLANNSLGSDSDSKYLNVKGNIESSTKPTTKPTASTTPGRKGKDVESNGKKKGLSGGAIAGITIGVLAFIVIIVIVVYCFCCKSRERAAYMKPDETGRAEKLEDGYRGKGNVSPGGRNDNHEMGEDGNAYDTVNPTGSGESSRGRGKPKKESQPAVYAQVDKENRQGKPLYATLDKVALDSKGSKKRDEDRAQPTEYAAIDHGRTADVPRADLV